MQNELSPAKSKLMDCALGKGEMSSFMRMAGYLLTGGVAMRFGAHSNLLTYAVSMPLELAAASSTTRYVYHVLGRVCSSMDEYSKRRASLLGFFAGAALIGYTSNLICTTDLLGPPPSFPESSQSYIENTTAAPTQCIPGTTFAMPNGKTACVISDGSPARQELQRKRLELTSTHG